MKSTAKALALLLTIGLSAAGWYSAVAQTANEKIAAPTPIAASAPTAVPALVPYSGIALGNDGKPLAGETAITFQIFKDEQGGEPVFVETQDVIPDATGCYKVQLGASLSSGLPAEVFANGDARWLEVQTSGQNPQPRVLMASVPYALKAGDATTLGGLPVSAFALAGQKTASETNAAISANVSNTATSVTSNGGTAGYIPDFSGAGTIADSPLFVASSGNVGVNMTAPTATLDVGGSENVRGTLNLPTLATATASAGQHSQLLELSASAWDSATNSTVSPTFKLLANFQGNNTANPAGDLEIHYQQGTMSTNLLSIGSNGNIAFAPTQTFPGTLSGVTAAAPLTATNTAGTVSLGFNMNSLLSTLDLSFPQLFANNNYLGNQSITGSLSTTAGITTGGPLQATSETLSSSLSAGGIVLPAIPTTQSTPITNSFPLDMQTIASSYPSGNFTADFRWQAEPGNGGEGVNPSVNLLYGTNGSAPAETGVAFNSIGTMATSSLTVGAAQSGLLGPGSSIQNGEIAAQSLSIAQPAGVDTTTPALIVQQDDNGVYRSTPEQLVIKGSGIPGQELLIGYLTGYPSGTETSGGYAAIQSTWTGNFNTPLILQPNGGCVCIRVSGSDASTNAGAGNTQPLVIGVGQGNAVADGWNTYSSRRWKTNIKTLPDALEKVEKLRGVSYDLKASGKHEIGVIAEEVGAVVPEIVQWEKNGKDAQSVDYTRLTALLIEATKAQQAEFEKAMRLIKSQQAQIRKQAASMKTLTAQVHAANESLQKVKQEWVAPQGAASTATLIGSR